MTHIEALKLALEALEESQTDNDTMEFWDRKSKAITAVKEALAQPEQEPWPEEPFGHMAGGVQPPQRPWVDLTDDELADLSASGMALWQLWRAIEAKLKEKNT